MASQEYKFHKIITHLIIWKIQLYSVIQNVILKFIRLYLINYRSNLNDVNYIMFKLIFMNV